MVVPPVPSLNQVLSHTVNLSKEMLTRGNETLLAVLGATSVVAKVCHYVGSFFHHYLMATDLTAAGEVAAAAAGGGGVVDAEERSVASVCAIVFFVLALQTGLTSLNPDKRLTRLYQNLCLLVTAIFHFIHNMVSSHLIALGASGSAGINYRCADHSHPHFVIYQSYRHLFVFIRPPFLYKPFNFHVSEST